RQYYTLEKEEGGCLVPGMNAPALLAALLVGGCGWLFGLLLESLAHAVEHMLAQRVRLGLLVGREHRVVRLRDHALADYHQLGQRLRLLVGQGTHLRLVKAAAA